MWLKATSYLIQFIIMSIVCDFGVTKPMFGPLVRFAEQHEFDYVVTIVEFIITERRVENNFICSGSLVTTRNILTAAHCTEDLNYNQVLIYVGSNDITTSRRYKIKWWITYNDWAASRDIIPEFRINDIANLRLRRQVHRSIVPIPLSTLTVQELYGENVTATAWSVDNEDIVPVQLKTVDVRVMTLEECTNRVTELHGSRVRISVRHICTHAVPHAVMTYGDSGGSIVHLGKLVGIHKATIPFPNEPRNPRKINVHVNVHHYRHFIRAVLDRHYRPPRN